MEARFKLVDRLASKLVEEFAHLYSPALKIDDLIEEQDVKIIEKDLGSSMSGASLYDGKDRIILINENEHENRKRFTKAHELGHVLLHQDQNLRVDNSDSNEVFLRDKDSSSGEYWREVEANNFAAAILMPKDLVEKEYRAICKSGSKSDELTEKLAKKFKVSVDAMTIRRQKLGF